MRGTICKDHPPRPGSERIVHLFDHGGQQEFQVTYSSLLTQPLSIFVVVIPVDSRGCKSKETGDVYRKATTPAESAVELQYWLSLLETVAHNVNQVAVVANIFPGTSMQDRENHVRQLRRVIRQHMGNLEGEAEGRLKFVHEAPITLSASSARDWQSSGGLFNHLNRAWDAVQCNSDPTSLDLTMPVLCQPLLKAIPRLRARLRHQKALLQDAAAALRLVRKQLGSIVEDFSDGALAALLQYAEQCGEVLLSRDTSKLTIVVWDPSWFATAVLGEFFQPAVWRPSLLRSVRMRREHVLGCLREILRDNQNLQADDEMLNHVLGLLEQMRLCIPIGSQREEWFPAFLNSAEKHTGFREADESLKREEAGASELLRKYLHIDPKDQQYQAAGVCGRLLLLTDRSGKAVKPDDELRSIFPCGSFSRFQARILEAFPNPAEEEGAASSAQPEACETFLSRNFVRLSWRGDDGKLCYFHSLMLHNDRGIEFAWIAWLWVSSNKVDVFMDGQREGDMATVMDQMIAWMEEASTIKRRKPAFVTERLRPSAFFADKSALLDDGADSFLKAHEQEIVVRKESTGGVCEQKGRDNDKINETMDAKGANDSAELEIAISYLLPTLKHYCASDFSDRHIIGSGAFGRVFCGRDDTNALVAIKEIEPENREGICDVLRELDTLRKAQCEEVVDFYGYYVTRQDGRVDKLGLVMQYAELGSFRALLNCFRSTGTQHGNVPLLRGVLMKVFTSVARGMEHFHSKGILHRDIKPENLLLFAPAGAEQAFHAKFCDF
eukprot:scaffold4901_cov141-Pinguiococcus_pyrenoidosus.AAC.1